ncbi:hypothetical protein K458DRAFT_373988 [Lentithecium fluviatile CBS 122367]|uniref:KANL3/Tex30 alpha/beta hydrolase-like domain-containing protein n=1 Tax=Lentithecium fluviatile CBS 122367 TaxID=1168545 RepID=A0A6G1IQ63_9PLEO|nr:hypothetical protein K458DRAFT_373988 [Lentithecium fluviatile CBS 122367]
MPPKRRKAAAPPDAPEPKKRVTRSSTKSQAASEPAKDTPKTSKPTKSTESKANKEKATKPEKKPNDQPSDGGNEPTTLTISHVSVKNPLTCHHYTPDSKNPPDAPTLIFTHGAGGTLSAPAVVNFCNGYSKGAPILAFQGSINLKARVKGFHACISHLETTNLKEKTLVLGGRSMGARTAVIAATEVLSSSSPPSDLKLMLVSYPLKGPKDDIRDQILLDLPSTIHILFVIGDKDVMCPLDMLNATRKKMAAESQLVVVKGADHGMHVKGKDKEQRVGEESGSRALGWVCGEMGDEVIWIADEE